MGHSSTGNPARVRTKDAMLALDKGDVTPALKWVTKGAELEIRAAFAKTSAVRSKGADARELADRYFFETPVRVHRAGEGAPFTGIKPAGTDPGAAVKASDKAPDAGSPDALVKTITGKVTAEVRERIVCVAEAKKQSGERAPRTPDRRQRAMRDSPIGYARPTRLFRRSP